MNILVMTDGEGEKNANRGDLDHWAEGFEAVKTSLLFDTLSESQAL